MALLGLHEYLNAVPRIYKLIEFNDGFVFRMEICVVFVNPPKLEVIQTNSIPNAFPVNKIWHLHSPEVFPYWSQLSKSFSMNGALTQNDIIIFYSDYMKNVFAFNSVPHCNFCSESSGGLSFSFFPRNPITYENNLFFHLITYLLYVHIYTAPCFLFKDIQSSYVHNANRWWYHDVLQGCWILYTNPVKPFQVSFPNSAWTSAPTPFRINVAHSNLWTPPKKKEIREKTQNSQYNSSWQVLFSAVLLGAEGFLYSSESTFHRIQQSLAACRGHWNSGRIKEGGVHPGPSTTPRVLSSRSLSTHTTPLHLGTFEMLPGARVGQCWGEVDAVNMMYVQ